MARSSTLALFVQGLVLVFPTLPGDAEISSDCEQILTILFHETITHISQLCSYQLIGKTKVKVDPIRKRAKGQSDKRPWELQETGVEYEKGEMMSVAVCTCNS